MVKRIEQPDGTIEYVNEYGQTHREDGPAVIYPDGIEYWWLNGKIHREDGPALILSDGTEFWYLNGEIHREDGPAVIYPNGTEIWYKNGVRHREDGPAIIFSGEEYWYLNDRKYSFNMWLQLVNISHEEKMELILRYG